MRMRNGYTESKIMGTREEIREGIRYQIAKGGSWDTMVWNVVNYLHSEKVRIEVERELPKLSQGEFEEWCGSHRIKGCGRTRTMCEDYCRGLAFIEKAGYVAVKPLIEVE